jgi:thioredoxin-dependent peroxiredoxin
MLSDESGEARKAYGVNRGLMGLSEGRVTFFVDSEGVVRYVMVFSTQFLEYLTSVAQ